MTPPHTDPLVVTPNIGEGNLFIAPVADPAHGQLITISTHTSHRASQNDPQAQGKYRHGRRSPGAEDILQSIFVRSSYPSAISPRRDFFISSFTTGIHAIAGHSLPPPRAVFNIVPGTAPTPRPLVEFPAAPARNRSRGGCRTLKGSPAIARTPASRFTE